MEQDWVLDVLTDLKIFAQQNGMFNLAEQLDDTLLVAAVDLRQDSRGSTKGGYGSEAGCSGRKVAPSPQP